MSSVRQELCYVFILSSTAMGNLDGLKNNIENSSAGSRKWIRCCGMVALADEYQVLSGKIYV